MLSGPCSMYMYKLVMSLDVGLCVIIQKKIHCACTSVITYAVAI